MRLTLLCATLTFVLTCGAGRASETYDLIFKMGTLSDVETSEVLEYKRDVTIPMDAAYGARNTGVVKLTFEAEEMARLKFHQGAKSKNVGAFPATVGNPVIMYFVETVLRDVAQHAGGSPFYIRNRIKESLVTKSDILDASVVIGDETVAAHVINLRPFENDKNREKMKGFGDLTLTFTMSEEVPGWYQSLRATVPGAQEGEWLYNNHLMLQGSELSQ